MNANSQAVDPAAIHSMSERFEKAAYCSVERVAEQIQCGIDMFQEQQGRPKGSRWQSEMAWLLDNVRNNAMDGIDVLVAILNHSDRDAATHHGEVRDGFILARKAIFSSGSPIQSALTFEKAVIPFLATCRKLVEILQEMLAQYREDEATRHAAKASLIVRAKPAEDQSQNPYGVGS